MDKSIVPGVLAVLIIASAVVWPSGWTLLAVVVALWAVMVCLIASAIQKEL